MEEQVKNQVEEQVETPIEEMGEVANNVSSNAQIIKDMILKGCKRINKIKIKNVTFSDMDNYTRVSFTLVNPVPGYVSDDNGITFRKGLTSVIHTGLFSILGMLKEQDDLGWIANHISANPQALNTIFNGGTLDIIQQEVHAGELYVNPFSVNKKESPLVNDTIINSIVKLVPSRIGEKALDIMMSKSMGF